MIRIELVQSFCRHMDLVVNDTELLDLYLTRDLFQTGISLFQTTILSLTIEIWMMYRTMFKTQMDTLFQAISQRLRESQSIAANFGLTFRVQTDCDRQSDNIGGVPTDVNTNVGARVERMEPNIYHCSRVQDVYVVL